MVTINDIAKRANVSVATISKVLNNQPGPSPETREAVLAIANELNYTITAAQQQKRKRINRTIGLITEEITAFTTPRLIDGIGVCCEERGYHYILGNLRFNSRFDNNPIHLQKKADLIQELTEDLQSRHASAILYVGAMTQMAIPLPVTENYHFISVFSASDNALIPAVIYDNRNAAYQATKLLLDKGHRKIGMIAGSVSTPHTMERLLGYQDALFEYGIPYNPQLTLYANWDRKQSYDYMPFLLQENVTAIFSQNDIMAMGVYDYCNEHGIRIGRDLSLIGFDDCEYASFCRPALSSISLPLFEIGHTATNILIDLLEAGTPPKKQITQLKCKLVERESSNYQPPSSSS